QGARARRAEEMAVNERNDAVRAGNDAQRATEEARKAQAEEKRQRALAESRLYAAHIPSALRALEDGDVATARSLLSGYLPGTGREHLRGFEWYHLWRLGRRERLTLGGHPRPITCVAFSPDGQTLATGGRDVRLYGVAGGPAQTLPPGRSVYGL